MDAVQTAQDSDVRPAVEAGEKDDDLSPGEAALDLLEMETLADKIIELLRRNLMLGIERQGRME